MTLTSGPDFVSFQVRDVERSAAFYEHTVGLRRLPTPNPAAAVFQAGASSFAVRTPFPGVDLDALAVPSGGVGVWFHNEDATGLHDRLVTEGTTVLEAPFDGPFGTQFTFRDPDGYVVTVHSRA